MEPCMALLVVKVIVYKLLAIVGQARIVHVDVIHVKM